MNRAQVIKEIQRRHLKRQPLNLSAVRRDAPELVAAVYAVRPYWGWKQALADAGLDYNQIRIAVRETVVCELCGGRYRSLGTHLIAMHEVAPDEYQEEYPEAELVSESTRERLMNRFRSGAHPDFLPHWEPVYTPEYVLDRLHTYAQLGYWMDHDNFSEVDVGLIAAVSNYLGGNWDDGLRQIGLDPAEYRGHIRDDDFTREQFRHWLDDRERRGRMNTCGEVLAERDPWGRRPRIAVWAIRQYGNWAEALEKAGVDLSRPVYGGHKYPKPQSVVEEIRRLYAQGADLSFVGTNVRAGGSLLTSAGSTFFGTWQAALDAAGVSREDRRRQTYYRSAREVSAAIRRRIEYGFSLAPLDVFYGTNRDVPLWKKAFECFGSWRAAVRQTGGSPAQVRQAGSGKFSSAAAVTEEMKRRRREGRLLATRELTDAEDDKCLYVMANGFFGHWQEAVRAAGEDPKAYHVKNLRPQGKYTSAEEVLAAIRRRQRGRLPLNARGITHGDHVDVPLLTSSRKFFGSWQAALEAAGVDYDSVACKRQDYESMKGRTYRRYPTPEAVLAGIRRRRREKLPVTHRALGHDPDFQQRDNALLTAGKKFFGTWDEALRAAGIDPARVQREWVPRRQAKLRRKRRQAK